MTYETLLSIIEPLALNLCTGDRLEFELELDMINYDLLIRDLNKFMQRNDILSKKSDITISTSLGLVYLKKPKLISTFTFH